MAKPSKQMQIKYLRISTLREHEKNPRRLTKKQHDDLMASMKNLGQLSPAVINTYPGRENIIVSGHQRLKIAAEMGLKEYPCIEVSFTPEKEEEALIRLNKNQASWDFDILANEFEADELVDLGFLESELFGLPNEVEGEEKLEEKEEELQSFKKTHVLISFAPSILPKIQKQLNQITQIEGVEYEQASN